MYGELQKVPDCSFSTFSPNPLKPGSKDAEGGATDLLGPPLLWNPSLRRRGCRETAAWCGVCNKP